MDMTPRKWIVVATLVGLPVPPLARWIARRGNAVDQNDEIPDASTSADHGSVVIYCLPFRVIFRKAALG